jgi:hypothetical protein
MVVLVVTGFVQRLGATAGPGPCSGAFDFTEVLRPWVTAHSFGEEPVAGRQVKTYLGYRTHSHYGLGTGHATSSDHGYCSSGGGGPRPE